MDNLSLVARPRFADWREDAGDDPSELEDLIRRHEKVRFEVMEWRLEFEGDEVDALRAYEDLVRFGLKGLWGASVEWCECKGGRGSFGFV